MYLRGAVLHLRGLPGPPSQVSSDEVAERRKIAILLLDDLATTLEGKPGTHIRSETVASLLFTVRNLFMEIGG